MMQTLRGMQVRCESNAPHPPHEVGGYTTTGWGDLSRFCPGTDYPLVALKLGDAMTPSYVQWDDDLKEREHFMTEQCIYCDSELEHGPDDVPASDDDAAWNAIATQHQDSCEWVITRAFNDHWQDCVVCLQEGISRLGIGRNPAGWMLCKTCKEDVS